MATWMGAGGLPANADTKKIVAYINELEEQIRYLSMHIGSENMEQDAISIEVLSPEIRKRITDGESTARITATAKKIEAKLEDKYGIVNGVAINESGVEITGKAITISADGTIDIHSGGKGSIELREGGGSVSAAYGRFDELMINDKTVLGTDQEKCYLVPMPVKLTYDGQQPAGNGYLWIDVQDDGGEAFAAANADTNTVINKDMHGNESRDLVTTRTGDMTDGGTYDYTMTIKVWNMGSKTVNARFGASAIRGDRRVDFPDETDWTYYTSLAKTSVVFKTRSTVNLFAAGATDLVLELRCLGVGGQISIARDTVATLEGHRIGSSDEVIKTTRIVYVT